MKFLVEILAGLDEAAIDADDSIQDPETSTFGRRATAQGVESRYENKRLAGRIEAGIPEESEECPWLAFAPFEFAAGHFGADRLRGRYALLILRFLLLPSRRFDSFNWYRLGFGRPSTTKPVSATAIKCEG